MRRRSNQRITKIKKDFIEELLKRAEGIDVKDATQVQPSGSDLIPYPDMNNLRLWTRDYLLKGLTKVYPVKLDEDGQTYLTTLIDGLPLFTKLTKTITATTSTPVVSDFGTILTKVGSPVINHEGIVSNFSVTNYLKSEIFTNTGTKYNLRFNVGSFGSNTGNVFNIPNNGGNVFLAVGYNTSNGIYAVVQGTVSTIVSSIKENDDVSLTITINDTTFTITSVVNSGTANTITINKNTTYNATDFQIGSNTVNTYCYGTFDFSKSSIELSDGTIHSFCKYSNEVQVETSKPGLWLSNLQQPISFSTAGSWLRHNLIHTFGDFNSVNSDTIGNYSYSFYQRGIIKRTAGSHHDDNDSFCQHWSPSALSCISHDAIIIPTNNLRSTYTSYQTLAVPSNPDMQMYNETLSKNVEFNFVDNLNGPVTNTQFNGRVVGRDWSYELLFTPNHSGNPGDDKPDNSTGGCITGTISYTSSTGITCTQNVNSCFETAQGTFNDDIPHNYDDEPLNDGTGDKITQTSTNCICQSSYPWRPEHYSLNCSEDRPKLAPTVSRNGLSTSWSSPSGFSSIDACWTNSDANFLYSCSSCGRLRQGTIYAVKSSVGNWKKDENPPDIDWTYAKVTVFLYEPQVPETGVNIYLNITDNKALFEAQGLPWTGDCSEPRFEFSYSTSPCTSYYCTSRIIARNVDISSDGFVSNLTSKQLNG